MKKILLFVIATAITGIISAQDCSDLFISEYVEGSGNNKAIELYNPTDQAIDMSSYYLVRYRNGGFVPNKVQLSGSIEAKGTYVFALDKRDPNGTGFEQPIDVELEEKADAFLCPVYSVNPMMYFNGNDAVTLEKVTGETVDVFGMIGPPMLEDDNGWTNINDTTISWNNGGVQQEYTIQNYIVGPLFWLSWTENNTLIRKASVKQGVKENPDVFMVHMEYDSLPENTFSNLGIHECDCAAASVNEIAEYTNVDIYPNPVLNGEFTISSAEKMQMVEIVDLLGASIYKENLDGNMKWQMNPDVVISGLYFVRISFSDNSVLTRKIIFR